MYLVRDEDFRTHWSEEACKAVVSTLDIEWIALSANGVLYICYPDPDSPSGTGMVVFTHES